MNEMFFFFSVTEWNVCCGPADPRSFYVIYRKNIQIFLFLFLYDEPSVPLAAPMYVEGSVVDPDPDWIRIQWGSWIRIRIRIQDGKNGPEK
jgi:hypothetical protein